MLQSVLAMKSRRTTIVAVIVAALMVFVVVPLAPALTYYATALAVIITIAVSWFARSKTRHVPLILWCQANPATPPDLPNPPTERKHGIDHSPRASD